MDAFTLQLIRDRANDCCEYCLVPRLAYYRFHLDHVIAEQHGGQSDLENICLCRMDCNLKKGPNIASIDPVTGQLVRLFNPRQDIWREHFELKGAGIIGMTEIGRATVFLLDFNTDARLTLRRSLLLEGLLQPRQ